MAPLDAPERPRDASMTLLNEIVKRPLDPGYAAAAERRKAAGLPGSTGLRSPLLIVTALVLGFVLVVAALTLRPAGTTASRDKAMLIDQIQSRQDQSDALEAEGSSLSTEIQILQDAALGGGQPALTSEIARLALITGEVAAEGPGLVLTIDDAADASAARQLNPRGGNAFAEGRVSALDLQVISNGLWESGAEAISINGQRLTSRAAIRFAGEAILVDYRPLSPPYAITVIGEPRAVQTRFASTTAGSYLKALGDNYKIRSSVKTSDRVVVPRSPSLDLTFARPPSGIPSSSAATPTGGPTSGSATAPRPSTPTSTKSPTPSEKTP